MIEILKIISLIFGIFLSGYAITKIFSPFFKRKKLNRFFELVQDWFDEIDKNLETGINLSILNNKENKITFYLEENHLNKYKIKISKSFVRKYLKKIGLKKELHNNLELFYKYSRCNSRKIYLKDFWNSLCGTFMQFHPAYKNGGKQYNYADIEMRVKFLRQYLKIKEK
jgi:hypothetical protein